MSDCCLIKKVATVEVYENKNEVRAYGFMAGDKNTPMMEVKFRHLWGEENLSKCKLRWIIVDDLGSLLVGEVPIEQDNTASIQLPNELFTGERRMKVQLTVASCDGNRILNLQQFTDLKVINNLASNEVVEPVYQMLINQVYDDTKKYLAELETSYKAKYGSLESVYAKSKASLEQYMITAENGGNAEFLQGYNPKNFNRVENTINELVNSAGSKYKVGDVVEVLGYYTAGDGAHHKRKIESADDGSGVQLANGLWANIVHDGEVNVSWFGAKGDGITDDTTAIQECLTYCCVSKRVFIPEGVFIAGDLLLENHIDIKGNGVNSTVFKLKNGCKTVMKTFDTPRKRKKKLYISDIQFSGIDDYDNSALVFEDSQKTDGEECPTLIENLVVSNFGGHGICFNTNHREARLNNIHSSYNLTGIFFKAMSDSLITNSTFNCNKEAGVKGTVTDFRISNTKVFVNKVGFHFIGGYVTFDNCTAQQNDLVSLKLEYSTANLVGFSISRPNESWGVVHADGIPMILEKSAVLGTVFIEDWLSETKPSVLGSFLCVGPSPKSSSLTLLTNINANYMIGKMVAINSEKGVLTDLNGINTLEAFPLTLIRNEIRDVGSEVVVYRFYINKNSGTSHAHTKLFFKTSGETEHEATFSIKAVDGNLITKIFETSSQQLKSRYDLKLKTIHETEEVAVFAVVIKVKERYDIPAIFAERTLLIDSTAGFDVYFDAKPIHATTGSVFSTDQEIELT